MICLDTNAIITIISGQPFNVRCRLDAALAEGKPIAIPSIALFELWFGIAKSQRIDGNTEALHAFLARGFEILPFDEDDAREAGAIRAALAKRGTPIGPYDVLIAAQARQRDAVLVTANVREFSRVPGLKLEDWTV
jgi:tRNA(fMet)-specific endonuclease VapC